MSKKSKSVYVVVKGHEPGIYTQWFGDQGAQEQVTGISGAIYKGFYNRDEAMAWLRELGEATLQSHAPELLKLINQSANAPQGESKLPNANHSQATKSKPAESKPADSKPAKSKPAKSKPAESKPARSKPAKSKPAKPKSNKSEQVQSNEVEAFLKADKYVIHTDGGAIRNPGPGGYGVVLRYQEHTKELSAGYRLTTNNRMELLACIEGLKAIKLERQVILYSDSKYVVNGIQKGWARRWRSNGWMRNEEEEAINSDLWAELLELCERHRVQLIWVKGHAGNMDNERCDELATEAIQGENLLIDTVYEEKQSGG
ncbi:MAG: ribonuclease HI [Chloroflexota bacterium]